VSSGRKSVDSGAFLVISIDRLGLRPHLMTRRRPRWLQMFRLQPVDPMKMAKKDTRMDSRTENLVGRVTDETLKRLAGGDTVLGSAAPGEGDVDDPALSEMDVFAYAGAKYVDRGEMVTFCIFRNNAQIATEDYPYSWEQLQQDYEPGHYMVKARSVSRGCWLKTESRTIASPSSKRGASGFRFGEQTESQVQKPADPMSAILLMMQQSQEKAEARAAEQRERDEIRRREEKILEDERRKQERESRNDLLKTLIPLALPLVEKVFSKKEGLDPSVSLVIEQLKESNRRLEDRLAALGSQNHALDTKMLLDLEQKAREREAAARKEGREEMEKIYEIAEERAESRAAEMIQSQGEKDESMTSVLIKSLAPALGAMIAQQQSQGGGVQPQLTPVEQSQEVVAVQGEPSRVASVTPIRGQSSKPNRAKPVAKSVAPRPRASQEDIDRQKILEIVMPFLVESFQRMAAGVQLTPEGAARESLELLALKGFRQDKVLSLFTKQHMETLVISKLPEQYHSWFNKYYAALDFKPGNGSAPASSESVFTGAQPTVKPGIAQGAVVVTSGGDAG
jgi:hypothetical protein